MAEQPAPKFPVSSGLLEPRHYAAMGKALWIYLILLDWQTDKDGTVRNGESVTTDQLRARLGCNEWTARKGLERLQSEGYIERDRGANGWVIRITKPKKRFRGHVQKPPIPTSENPRSGESARAKTPDLSCKNPRSLLSLPLKEDLNLSKRTKPERAREDRLTAIFETIRSEHPRGHNPKPNLAAQAFLSRFNTIPAAEECLRQHREKWQPVWSLGRKVPDLSTWIRDYDAEADIAADEPKQPTPQPSVIEMRARKHGVSVEDFLAGRYEEKNK